jgi:hypothetical protein
MVVDRNTLDLWLVNKTRNGESSSDSNAHHGATVITVRENIRYCDGFLRPSLDVVVHSHQNIGFVWFFVTKCLAESTALVRPPKSCQRFRNANV